MGPVNDSHLRTHELLKYIEVLPIISRSLR